MRASAWASWTTPCLRVERAVEPPRPSPREGLTSAWPPGVSVLLQRSHLRQNLCQSLPRELTFSAGERRGGQGRCPRGPALPRVSGTLPTLGCELEHASYPGFPAQAPVNPQHHICPSFYTPASHCP